LIKKKKNIFIDNKGESQLHKIRPPIDIFKNHQVLLYILLYLNYVSCNNENLSCNCV